MGNAECCRLEAEPQAPMQCQTANSEPRTLLAYNAQPFDADPADAGTTAKKASGFTIEVHSANLLRSFAKVGTMNPYAVVRMRLGDGGALEIMRTKPSPGAHMAPWWDVDNVKVLEDLPDELEIDIWDKNKYHRDVFCGSTTIPCSTEMGCLERQTFGIEKRSKSTGAVCVSLRMQLSPAQRSQTKRRERQATETTIGGEFDDVFEAMAGRPTRSLRQVTILSLTRDELDADKDPEDTDEDDEEVPARQRLPSKPSSAFPAAALVGSWTCVATEGLDEFLIKSGAGVFQRKIAKAAKWPSWDFTADGDNMVFVNHSAIGDIVEQIPFNKEYQWTDGKKNEWTCQATWRDTPGGGTLTIARRGKEGEYTEERVVIGDKLEFKLANPKVGVDWGRSFTRD